MSEKARRDPVKLKTLIDNLVEDLLATPDTELLQQAEAAGVNVESLIGAVRGDLMREVAIYRKRLLVEAQTGFRERVSMEQESARRKKPTREQMEALVARLLSERSGDIPKSLTLAFREGRMMSDNEMESLIDDLTELDLITAEDDEK